MVKSLAQPFSQERKLAQTHYFGDQSIGINSCSVGLECSQIQTSYPGGFLPNPLSGSFATLQCNEGSYQIIRLTGSAVVRKECAGALVSASWSFWNQPRQLEASWEKSRSFPQIQARGSAVLSRSMAGAVPFQDTFLAVPLSPLFLFWRWKKRANPWRC